jgi:ADP-heptose:LPS heptosyltransferase
VLLICGSAVSIAGRDRIDDRRGRSLPMMSAGRMRRLDALLGHFLCWCLTLHRRVSERVAGAQPPPPVSRILLIKLIEQGATVLAYDAVRAAIDRVGRDNVFFCVFVENRGILDIMELIPPDNVFTIRSDTVTHMLADALVVIRRARTIGIDTAIDMEFFARGSAILSYLTGAARRVGLHRFTEGAPYRGDLMTHRLIQNPFLHVARAYRLLVDAIDADPRDVPLIKVPGNAPEPTLPVFAPSDAECARVSAIVAEIAGAQPEGPIVLLNPNAGDLMPLRKWPADRFVELGRRLLSARPDVTVLVTGNMAERDAAEGLCRRIESPAAHSIAGRLTLREMMVLYTLADVLVTNDSGPGHFSSLAPIHSIVMFGPGSPEQYGPIGQQSEVLTAAFACSPCLHALNHRISPCTDNRCMQAISVETVLVAVLARLPAPIVATAASAAR